MDVCSVGKEEIYENYHQTANNVHTASNIPFKKTYIASIQKSDSSKKAKISPVHKDELSYAEHCYLSNDHLESSNANNSNVITTESNTNCNSSTSNCCSQDANHSRKPVRDQWDAFGELIANELRNYNSDISRKRLKRKIMQSMLEVGEEDDRL